MKKLLILILICILSIKYIECYPNPLFDADPESAPDIGEYFDLTNLNLKSKGTESPLFDLAPPYPLNTSTPPIPATSIFDTQRKVVYYSIGQPNSPGYRYFVNETHTFQIFTYPGGATCFFVPNYTYSKNILEFKWLRRSGSLRLSEAYKKLNLKKQIDDIFGKKNKICKKSPDDDIVDRYVGIMNDGSSCGSDCGDQKGGVVINMFSSRYAKVCYGKNIVIQQTIQQFYPTQAFSGSIRNQYQAIYEFNKFSAPGNEIIAFQQEVDQLCQNAPDYAYFYNSDCPWPLQQEIKCGLASKIFTPFNDFLQKKK